MLINYQTHVSVSGVTGRDVYKRRSTLHKRIFKKCVHVDVMKVLKDSCSFPSRSRKESPVSERGEAQTSSFPPYCDPKSLRVAVFAFYLFTFWPLFGLNVIVNG